MKIINKNSLEKLLGREDRKEIIFIESPIPEKIDIEDYVIKKANEICKAVRDLFGWGTEWYGFLVSENNKIVDIALEKNEVNQCAYTRISPESIARAAYKAQDQNKKVSGWIHSHGSMSVFFSGTDAENIKTVLNSVSLNNRAYYKNEEIISDNLSVIINDNMRNISGLAVKIDGNRYLNVDKVTIFEPVYVGWSYNIVVNDKGEHYQEIATIEEKLLTKETNMARYPAELNLIATDKVVDYESLKEEVSSIITRRSSFWREFYWEQGTQLKTEPLLVIKPIRMIKHPKKVHHRSTVLATVCDYFISVKDYFVNYIKWKKDSIDNSEFKDGTNKN